MEHSLSDTCKVLQGCCSTVLRSEHLQKRIDLSFLDPPFNQSKTYNAWDDNLPSSAYWKWMQEICEIVFSLTSEGGAIYFMQREKNTEYVLQCLRNSGWTFQNLIIWKKKTSAVPGMKRYGKHYQIIAFATKGKTPRVFNRLRIDPPLPSDYKYDRENGMYVTDVWDDIRELTSGYFAGEEALRDSEGKRLHKQQSPIQLLLRIILSSTRPGDVVLDPFSGSGTTLAVSEQLHRESIGIELDEFNVNLIQDRLSEQRKSDDVSRYYKDYTFTHNLDEIWGERFKKNKSTTSESVHIEQMTLLERQQ